MSVDFRELTRCSVITQYVTLQIWVTKTCICVVTGYWQTELWKIHQAAYS
jgi:hypothetical protein